MKVAESLGQLQKKIKLPFTAADIHRLFPVNARPRHWKGLQIATTVPAAVPLIPEEVQNNPALPSKTLHNILDTGHLPMQFPVKFSYGFQLPSQ